jgi:hypothetical protein
MALAAADVMKAHGRTEILIGGVDAMPPAIQAVVDGRMHATVRNSSCRIHGGAIVAGVAAGARAEDRPPDPEADRHRRPDRHQGECPGDAVDGGAVPVLTMRNQHKVRLSLSVAVCLIGAVATMKCQQIARAAELSPMARRSLIASAASTEMLPKSERLI